MTREERLERALRVIVQTPGTLEFLLDNDIKGLEQASLALGQCPICGQGGQEAGYEHKSSCKMFRDFADNQGQE